jgi:hypothetical protein
MHGEKSKLVNSFQENVMKKKEEMKTVPPLVDEVLVWKR